MIRPAVLIVCLTIASCASSTDETVPSASITEPAAPVDIDVDEVRSYLKCQRPSRGALAKSNRVEACRILGEFEQSATFDLWPRSGEETWIGRWHDCPHPDAEIANDGPFIVIRLKISSFDLGPESLRLLSINDVLPYSVRNLVLDTDPESQDDRSYTHLVEALASNREPPSPQLAQQLKSMTTMPGNRGRLSLPSAVARTKGTSVQFHDVAGRDPKVRQTRDGRRMLMVSGGSTFELWRIP